MLGRLIETGYEAVYITEHDAVWAFDELDDLRAEFPEVRIFPGVELTLGPHHLLVLGSNDANYLSLRDERKVLEKARGEDHLTILSHPFRWPGAAEMFDEGLLPDALEYYTANHEPDMAGKALSESIRLKLPLVNSSDAHSVEMIGHYWIKTHLPLGEADDIRRIVLAGEYDLRSASD
jgi:predicted metal-dependent phosphoesterase TrpH